MLIFELYRVGYLKIYFSIRVSLVVDFGVFAEKILNVVVWWVRISIGIVIKW